MKIKIKGNELKIKFVDMENKDYDGLTDSSSKTIYISSNDNNDDELKLDNWKEYQKKVMRHELIHAFLFESGLGASMFHTTNGHDEQTIDWFANIYPEYKRVCEELKI